MRVRLLAGISQTNLAAPFATSALGVLLAFPQALLSESSLGLKSF